MWNERTIALAIRAVILSLQKSGPAPREAVVRLLIEQGVPKTSVLDILDAAMSWELFEDRGRGRLGANSSFGEPRPVTVTPPG